MTTCGCAGHRAECAECLLVVRVVCVLFAGGALREVSSYRRLPARPVTTSHRVHTGLEVGEVVDKFEADAAQQCVSSLACHRACAVHCVLVTHQSDDVRLRWTPCRVRGVSACCPCSVCPFCGRGYARGLIVPATASTPSLRERPRFARRRTTRHTLPQPLCAQDQDPEPLALPWPAWEPRPRQQVVSAPASQTS